MKRKAGDFLRKIFGGTEPKNQDDSTEDADDSPHDLAHRDSEYRSQFPGNLQDFSETTTQHSTDAKSSGAQAHSGLYNLEQE